jgi:integrase
MPRTRGDGTRAEPPNRRVLTELVVRKTRATGKPLNVWDLRERGLVLRVQPSGHRAFKFVYSFRGKARWYHIGSVPLADARRIAVRLRLAVAEGKDPLGEFRAERDAHTFGLLAKRYVEESAKKKNKSWAQAEYLVRKNLLPRWEGISAKSITRADVRAAMAKITSPTTANQTVAAASAIFSWAVNQEILALNPCSGVERNPTSSRERVLSDSEVRQFWDEVSGAGLTRSAALKTILLTGQRPGEVAHMRREHIADNWWIMPGKPDASVGWPGTKNAQSHRVWLPEAARRVIADASAASEPTGFVFGGAVTNLAEVMSALCQQLGWERATPHDDEPDPEPQRRRHRLSL